MPNVIETACPHDCPDACSMLAYVEGGKLLRVAGNVDNSFTRGNLCRKVAHFDERVYSPDRLLYPMRRVGKKGAGKFERITWDEAIDEITSRWKAIIAESGPEAILPYSYAGTMGVVNMSACDGRLWNRMGATQLQRTICSSGNDATTSIQPHPNLPIARKQKRCRTEALPVCSTCRDSGMQMLSLWYISSIRIFLRKLMLFRNSSHVS